MTSWIRLVATEYGIFKALCPSFMPDEEKIARGWIVEGSEDERILRERLETEIKERWGRAKSKRRIPRFRSKCR